ncbi:MBL fold metallo-hydrolase [Halotalea alkalilenta]|uniref:Metallo-beta-lactamase domain-containing protein n=1 Tax=Halotalea alkalilenta TaxID=376489 RepID=A0A172YGK1_9GAMM|nr:MBL fold metallo-hydrolase [Halotalea alkalilenta]ANF58420.1 hypothetical protein A5892_13855 [Halotalea alkalilenta]
MEYKLITVTPFVQNCTLLICPQTRRAVLVDPGGEPDRIEAEIERSDAVVEKILITHGHFDHIGAVAEMSHRLNVPVFGPHILDQFLIEAVGEIAKAYNLPEPESFVPERWLEEGDRIEVGRHVLEVLHCPGHSPGHVIFVDREARLIQMGDVLFKGSVGRTDLPGGDMRQLLGSIRHKLWPLGDDMRFIPGHGEISTLGEERLHNPFVK